MKKHNLLCKIKILDHVNCILIGLRPQDLMYFHELYAEFVPGHFFQPKFQFTKWDGKIHYFSQTGKFYVNLLEDIVPRIIGLGYRLEITDKREKVLAKPEPIDENFFSHIIEPDYQEPWVVRPYQVELVNALLDAGGGVGIAGTGSGKTGCCAAIALAYEQSNNFKSIIIVPDKNLTNQTSKDYRFFGLDVGMYYSEEKDVDHQHLVSTWQSLQRNPTLLHNYQVIIVDECHGIRAKVLTELLNEHAKKIAIRFGVTGTIPKEPADAMAIKISVGPVRCVIPAHELIDKGYLARLHIDIIQHKIDFHAEYEEYLDEATDLVPLTYKQFKKQYFPDWVSEKRFLQTSPERLDWIATYIKIKSDEKKGNVLCLVDGIRFGKKLAKMIPGAVFLYGNDEMDDRQKVFQMFAENDNLVVIASIKIASTGLNIRRIFNLMFIDVGKSFVRTIQSIGRGLRTAKDKEHVHVTDICSDLPASGRHKNQRIKFYKGENYKFKQRKVDYLQ